MDTCLYREPIDISMVQLRCRTRSWTAPRLLCWCWGYCSVLIGFRMLFSAPKQQSDGRNTAWRSDHNTEPSGQQYHGAGHGWSRHVVGEGLPSASELNATSFYTRSTLVLVRPNQGTTESKPRYDQGTTKLRSPLQGFFVFVVNSPGMPYPIRTTIRRPLFHVH